MFCPNCGKNVEGKFCFYCGATLTPTSEQPAQPQAQPVQYAQPAQPQAQPVQYAQPAQPQAQPVQYAQPAQPQAQPVQYAQPAQPQAQPVQYAQPAQPQAQPVQYAQPAQPQYNGYQPPIPPIQQGGAAVNKKSKAPVLIAVIAVITAIAVVLCIIFGASAGGGSKKPTSELLLQDDYAIYNGELIEGFGGSWSTNNTVKCMGADVYYTRLGDGFGVVVNGAEYDKIKTTSDDSMKSSLNGIVYSYNGDYMLYVSNNTLYLYDRLNKDSEKIARDVGSFCISPDGLTVMYSIPSEGTFTYKDGETEEVTDDYYCISLGISNGGEYKYVYKAHTNDIVCYDSEGEEHVLYQHHNEKYNFAHTYPNGIAFNIDNTQIQISSDGFFLVYDGYTKACCYGMYGDEDNPVSEDCTTPGSIVPVTGQYSYGYGYGYLNDTVFPRIRHTNADSLMNCFYERVNGRDVVCVKDGKMTLPTGEIQSPYNILNISPDGQTALVSCSNRSSSASEDELGIYTVSLSDGKLNKIIDHGVDGVGVTQDFKRVFWHIGKQLFTANIDGSGKKLLDDYVSFENYRVGLNYIGVMTPIILGNDRIVYGASDGTICMVDVNGNKTEIGDDLKVYNSDYPVEYNRSLPETGLFYVNRADGYFYKTQKCAALYKDDDIIIIDSSGNMTEH